MLYDHDGARKYLNANERRRFIAAAHQLDDRASRTFCLVMCYTGCRISEALMLTANKVDDSDRKLVFTTLKQRGVVRYRPLPIPASLAAEIGILLRRAPPDAAVWPISRSTGWRLIKHCMQQAGIRGSQASPKGLRHGFAVACIQNGIPITTVQKWLGHRHLNTTSIYLDFAGVDERQLARRTWEKAV